MSKIFLIALIAMIIFQVMGIRMQSKRSSHLTTLMDNIIKEDILIMHDDMDLPVGSVRIRSKGSSGGQKGMKSIIEQLGTSDITRIRIGVGHSNRGEHDKVPDWVLSPVPKAEQEEFDKALDFSAEAALAWVNEPINVVMSKYNIKK